MNCESGPEVQRFLFFIWLLKMRSLTRTGSEEDEIC